MLRFSLTTFPAPAKWAVQGRFASWAWEEVCQVTAKPELWPAGESVEGSESRLPGWTFTQYIDDSRIASKDEEVAARANTRRIVAVHGLTVDYEDEPAVDAKHIETWWGRFGYIAHTTAFHLQPLGKRPPGPRWRVMVPFTRPVELDEALLVARWASHPHRQAGMVSERATDLWRYHPVPAICPEGYHYALHRGPALEPSSVIAEMRHWDKEDAIHRAELTLAGTSVLDTAGRFLDGWRQREAIGAMRWPASLADRLPAPRPDQVHVLASPPGANRTRVALDMARTAAAAGTPTLYVSAYQSADALLVGALQADKAAAAPSDHDWRARRVPIETARGACHALAERYPALHLWSARSADMARLEDLVRATSEAHSDRPPLVLLDTVEGLGLRWSALADLARPGVLHPEWPGACVVALTAEATLPDDAREVATSTTRGLP